MNKLLLSSMFGIVAVSSCPVLAQPFTFERKAPQAPQFFVPNSAVTQQEKLPPFHVPQPIETKTEIIEINTQPTAPVVSPSQSIDFEPEKIVSQSPTESLNFNPDIEISTEDTGSKLPEIPQYQKEYDAYRQDLEHIEKNGKALVNPVLQHDLELMNSDEPLPVDENGKILHPFQQSQLMHASPEVMPAQKERTPDWTSESHVLGQIEIARDTPEPVGPENIISEKIVKEKLVNPFANIPEVVETHNKSSLSSLPLSPEAQAYFRGRRSIFAEEPETDKHSNDSQLKPLPLISKQPKEETLSESAQQEVPEQPSEEIQTLPVEHKPNKTSSFSRSYRQNRGSGHRTNSSESHGVSVSSHGVQTNLGAHFIR